MKATFTTLLYASDTSEHSASALIYSHALARRMNCRLHVLHVYSLPPVSRSTIQKRAHFENSIRKEKEELLQAYCQKHLGKIKEGEDISFTVVQSDDVSNSILERANDIAADLLLTGMKDSHSKRGLLAGNIAYKLLKHASCPLLLLPHGTLPMDPKKLAYATDFEQADLEALPVLVAIAKVFEARIEVLHIPVHDEYPSTQQMEWFRDMLEEREDYNSVEFIILPAENVRHGIAEYVKQEKIELLAMLEREEKGILPTFLQRDRVKLMTQLVRVPLLSFRKNGEINE